MIHVAPISIFRCAFLSILLDKEKKKEKNKEKKKRP